MARATPSLLVLILACGLPALSYAHGTERHFGTPINDRTPAPDGGGSPAFTLLALTANLGGLERELQEGQTQGVRERARRLPAMARELVRRSAHLGGSERADIDRAAGFITDCAKRIDAAADGGRDSQILRELARLRDRIATLEDLVRAVEN